MSYYIFVKTPDFDYGVFEMSAEPVNIGRGRDQSICLSDGEVSRKHLKIQIIGDDLCIKDLGSKNGTFLNGDLVEKGADIPVYCTDEIRLGKTIVTIADHPDIKRTLIPEYKSTSGKALETVMSNCGTDDLLAVQHDFPLLLDMLEQIYMARTQEDVIKVLLEKKQ